MLHIEWQDHDWPPLYTPPCICVGKRSSMATAALAYNHKKALFFLERSQTWDPTRLLPDRGLLIRACLTRLRYSRPPVPGDWQTSLCLIFASFPANSRAIHQTQNQTAHQRHGISLPQAQCPQIIGDRWWRMGAAATLTLPGPHRASRHAAVERCGQQAQRGQRDVG